MNTDPIIPTLPRLPCLFGTHCVLNEIGGAPVAVERYVEVGVFSLTNYGCTESGEKGFKKYGIIAPPYRSVGTSYIQRFSR